jgi:hypothetical protein
MGAGNAILDKALGPSFDYLQTIQSPADLHVSDNGSLSQVGTNANAIVTYVDNIITGPKSGNQFFKDTGGMCRLAGSKDDKGNDKGDGPVVPRSTYTNNLLGMDDASAVLGSSFARAVEGSGFDGIVPAMGGDIASMNALKLMNGLVLDGVPPCQAYTCPVTDIKTGVPQGNESRFLTPQLEFNMRPCKVASADTANGLLAKFQAEQTAAAKKGKAPVKKEKVKGKLGTPETYANFQDNLYQAPVPVEYIDPLSYYTLGAAVLVFLGYVLMK